MIDVLTTGVVPLLTESGLLSLPGTVALGLTEASVPLITDTAVELFTHRYTYLLFAILLSVGLYMMIASPNLVKKVIGLNLFQTAVFLFFVSTAYVDGGSAPVIPPEATAGDLYASPLPHVIVLTAIVVGVALTAAALALLVRIYSEYGTLREDVLREVLADD